MSDALLAARGLVRAYDHGRIAALRGVDLDVEAGEFLAIRGPSGSGKSTLLYLLGALDVPTGGDVLYRGQSLARLSDPDGYRSRCVGFVFQAFHLLACLTAAQNVEAPMIETGGTARMRRARAADLLREVGLESRARQYPGDLSAGERQRVAIARALANEPRILLADEPTGNLDSESAARVMDLLARLQNERQMTLVVVTHESEIAARARRNVRIQDGRIVHDTR